MACTCSQSCVGAHTVEQGSLTSCLFVAGEPLRRARSSSARRCGGRPSALASQRCARVSLSTMSRPLASRPRPARHACARARAHDHAHTAYPRYPRRPLSLFPTPAQAQHATQPAQGGGGGRDSGAGCSTAMSAAVRRRTRASSARASSAPRRRTDPNYHLHRGEE